MADAEKKTGRIVQIGSNASAPSFAQKRDPSRKATSATL